MCDRCDTCALHQPGLVLRSRGKSVNFRMCFLIESEHRRLPTHEIKTKAPHSRRRGKWREEEKRRGPTAAAEGPESSEKYDREPMREEEEEEGRRTRGRRRRRKKNGESIPGGKVCHTDLQRRTDERMLWDPASQHTEDSAFFHTNFFFFFLILHE